MSITSASASAESDPQDELVKKFYGNPDDPETTINGSGGDDHEKAQEKIAQLLKRFYYKVETEKKALCETLGLDDMPDSQKPYSIDVLALFPRSKLDKGDNDMCNWTIRFASIAVEIDTSTPKKVKGRGKTGHKSKRAHIKDLVREQEIKAKYGIDIFVRFEATDISQEKRYDKIGEDTFLEEMGITKFPYDRYYNNNKRKH